MIDNSIFRSLSSNQFFKKKKKSQEIGFLFDRFILILSQYNMSGEEFTGDKNKKTISAFGGRLQVERPDFYFAPSKTYGILGWIETIIKGLAGIIAIVTITGITIGAPISRYVNGLRMGQVILIGMSIYTITSNSHLIKNSLKVF